MRKVSLKAKGENMVKETESIEAKPGAMATGPTGPESGSNPFETQPRFEEYIRKISVLRADGEDKIISLQGEIKDIKRNKQIDRETKKKIIESDRQLIAKARIIKAKNKSAVREIAAKALKEASQAGSVYYNQVKDVQDAEISKAKTQYAAKVQEENNAHEQRSADIGVIETQKGSVSQVRIAEYKAKVKAEKVFHKARLGEIASARNDVVGKAKDLKYEAYLDKYAYQSKVRNTRHSLLEQWEFSLRHYAYAYNFRNWFLKNALYLIILGFYIICIIASKGRLLDISNILGILDQSSTKLFFSLGVAGLILIGGTDLSIGRMTGMAACFSCIFLADQGYTTKIGGFTIDTTSWPTGSRVIAGILFCIFVCTLFSSIAGFFSAKFKMHPFITTLSTQLLILAIMMINYSNYPAFNMNSAIKSTLSGSSIAIPTIGSGYDIIIMLLSAVFIFLMWFIWNKTKFGKNMYAVGGNSEAASVSGISVFWTTLGIFIMAGIMYGIGGFLEGVRIGVATPTTGSGTELDAIAACVVGGISFSGGVGKISGAVIGTIIFTGMTYCLTNLGFDVNYQYLFKGIIIMAAVCLDSIKYLKKK
jgi:methyl-galactoside transport system permease protein